MYVFVSNSYSAIIESKEVLDVLSRLFPYPKFTKVRNRESALVFLDRYKRTHRNSDIYRYGDIDKDNGYVDVQYYIENGIGYVSIKNVSGKLLLYSNSPNVIVSSSPKLSKIVVKNLNLNDSSIQSHILLITAVMELLDAVDVCIEVKDISIYLAMTAYKGKNKVITNLQEILKNRLGGIAYSV